MLPERSRMRPGRVLDLARLDFGGGWGSPGPSWASLGHLLGALGRFLGASWALLGASWLVSGASGVHLSSPGRPRPRFWEPPGLILKAPGLLF